MWVVPYSQLYALIDMPGTERIAVFPTTASQVCSCFSVVIHLTTHRLIVLAPRMPLIEQKCTLNGLSWLLQLHRTQGFPYTLIDSATNSSNIWRILCDQQNSK